MNTDAIPVTVMVDDFGSVNIDAQLIGIGNEVKDGKASIVELSNGCICCSMGDGLGLALRQHWP